MENLKTDEETVPEKKKGIKNPEDFFEEILHTSPVVDSGKDGIILKIDISGFDPSVIEAMKESGVDISMEDGYALKILKIYRVGDGEREYNVQKAAYELLKDAPETAKIPKPIIVRVQHLSDADKLYLGKYNLFLEDDAEIILMDFIEGKDLTNYVYDFILSKNGYDEQVIGNMDLDQKHELIADLVNFETPSNSTVGNINLNEVIAMRDNVRKLMTYLKKTDFHIDQNILNQIKRALDILESNQIFHNDLSERNIMIGNNGIPYIIDFGRSINVKNDQNFDDHAVIRRFEALNKKETAEDDREYWENFGNKIIKSKNSTQTFEKWQISLTGGKQDIIFNSIMSASAIESQFEQYVGILAYMFGVADDKSKKEIIDIIKKLHISLKNEYAKRRIGNFKKYIENSL